jgi:acetyl esterase/lipase
MSSKLLRRHGANALLGLALAMPVLAMAADAAPAFVFRTVPAQPMALPNAVVLDAGPAAPASQWTGLPNERILRNVMAPSLYPVRPAAGRANGRAVLVVPGGGYKFVAIENEGLPVAQRLADAGYTAFVLVYRVQPTPVADDDFAAAINREIAERFAKPAQAAGDLPPYAPAVEDARLSMRWLRSHAGDFSVDPGRIGFLGFSAGARTGRALAEQAEALDMPATLGLIYGGLFEARPRAPVPPLFVAQAADDPLFPVRGFELLQSWRQAGQRYELHLFERGGHGFGLIPRGTTSDHWMDAYLAWLARQ